GLSCIYQVDFLFFEISRCLLRCLRIALRIADCQNKLFPLFKPQLFETGPEPVNYLVPCATGRDTTNPVDLRLLRVSGTETHKDHGAKSEYEDLEFLTIACCLVANGYLRKQKTEKKLRPRINLPMIRFSPTGVKPQDLPVEGVDKIALVVILKTGKEGVVDD